MSSLPSLLTSNALDASKSLLALTVCCFQVISPAPARDDQRIKQAEPVNPRSIMSLFAMKSESQGFLPMD